MKNITKQPSFFIILFLIMIGFLTFVLNSCSTKPVIENGDVVEKCVIDSMVRVGQHSTIEPDMRYKYFTSKGTEFTSTHKYRLGDTLTFVYKKVK